MTPAICPTCQVGTYDEGATALHARIAELTRERDEAQSTVMQLRADVRNLVKALRGYHRAADSWPYARWSAEMHAAEAALESVGMAKRK